LKSNISPYDTLPFRSAARPVHVVRWEVPSRPAAAPSLERKHVAFVGSFGHAPNADAARWLISEIMPAVRRRDPEIECWLVGSDLPADLAALCGDGCAALGPVEDLGQVFERVRLTVAPLAYGAGVKGKVLDSFAAGLPCVCSPVAAEGLDLPPPLTELVADGAEAIAETIVRLHQSRADAERLSDAARRFVAANCSAVAVDEALRRACGLRDGSASA